LRFESGGFSSSIFFDCFIQKFFWVFFRACSFCAGLLFAFFPVAADVLRFAVSAKA
jgi:hypothetical protein